MKRRSSNGVGILSAVFLLSVPSARLSGADGARGDKVVHVIVALCDNRNQGIAPVPAALGNGQDPENNLYWGALYGVKTFFRRSPNWTEVSTPKPPNAAVLRRVVFKNNDAASPLYVVADAYDGAKMKDALRAFFGAAAGASAEQVALGGAPATTIAAGGAAGLVCFVGHNGLMDAALERLPEAAVGAGTGSRKAVVLACKSQAYFSAPLKAAQCEPLLTTTGLMAPEAYVLDAALRAWHAGESPDSVRRKAAQAYARYQKISVRAAEGLFAARD